MKQKKLFHIIVASGFGSGFAPFAPGTAGAALATVIWIVLSLFAPLSLLSITVALIVIFTVLGVWSANVLEPVWGKDPSRIVVDEMVGVWISLLAASAGNLYHALIAFALFRLFDIYKPLGIRKMEDLKGGWGVMMDDVLAGVYGFIILWGGRWLIG
ncbi:MAG: phosphatidylglycerophosphatase A [Prevotella sp.]|jgi:phosphatidylglycerophosphatase A|nr:phosphatidylglycerophosphatase A [Prevotella sp.]